MKITLDHLNNLNRAELIDLDKLLQGKVVDFLVRTKGRHAGLIGDLNNVDYAILSAAQKDSLDVLAQKLTSELQTCKHMLTELGWSSSANTKNVIRVMSIMEMKNLPRKARVNPS
jgi:hypothetical protein